MSLLKNNVTVDQTVCCNIAFGSHSLLLYIYTFYISQEFDKVPMFMKTAPESIDPEKHPDLACIQSIIHDDDRTPEGVWFFILLWLCFFM